MFENRVLRRIFGPKRIVVTGEWKKLHYEELNNLYSFPDINRQIKSRRMRWAEYVACMGEERKLYNIFVGKPEGNTLLGRPTRRWEDGIRMDLREIGLGSVDWIRLACSFTVVVYIFIIIRSTADQIFYTRQTLEKRGYIILQYVRFFIDFKKT
jgi:hypothetical protein